MGSKKKLNIPVAVICVLLFFITPFLGVFAVFVARKIILIDCDEKGQNSQGSILTSKNLEEIFFGKMTDNAPKDSYPARNEMGSFGKDSGGFFSDIAKPKAKTHHSREPEVETFGQGSGDFFRDDDTDQIAPRRSNEASKESFGRDNGGFFKDVASAGGVHNVNMTNLNQTVHARAVEDLKALLKAGIIEKDEYNQRLKDLK